MNQQVTAPSATWRVPYGRYGPGGWEGELVAYWEVDLDPISDDYSVRETSAAELLRIWANRVGKKYPDGLIPIYWFVECDEQGKSASMPFAYDHFHGEFPSAKEDFLWHWGGPVSTTTGQPLRWFDLPVIDKLWNDETSNKGGFIQEATGWKPSILQPFVYLPSLLHGGGH